MLTSGLHHLNDDLREEVTGQSSRNPKLIKFNVISFKVPDDSRLTRTICSCLPPVDQRAKKPNGPFFNFDSQTWKSGDQSNIYLFLVQIHNDIRQEESAG